MSAKEITSDSEALQQKIRDRAYAIWDSCGRPDGCDLDHWFQAEAEAMGSESAAVPTTTDANTPNPKSA